MAHNYPNGNHRRLRFALPPLISRPPLFCCPVAESNPTHLPRSFVNPGRHLMNSQLRKFLECADDAEHTFEKCDVSHIIEVTTRALHNNALPSHGWPAEQQWNLRSGPSNTSLTSFTPPLEETEATKMAVDDEELSGAEIPYSTYQSMSTRYFISQSSDKTWQTPPNSRNYQSNNPKPNPSKTGPERYMEIPPFKTLPYTSEGSAGGAGARPWMPSCSVLMWCTKHDQFYEVHVLS
ncbi:uncharacterized protein Z520_00291 [Fonsecaea multimorphosa CBS 102226]|uniref:Uncharacterized protein n=1 Tax=Fonsecaea multimorphosa CBS 102226 TaxID=1442371 RepID=A0A0D2KJC3_9EURO|nr:uncharacterized protein Z520_00291 [Fonsecaea multimorphosa CBS 102226]KIY03600.1 hypothetical protein Z520_00291 [Fonsecaea multimorphosa CBS 102226]OAL32301.1 hypothetical protein AYO22_00323 [Fonsecaea multimorphosa]